MTADQVYSVARQAGFSPDAAVMMTALARRESSYRPEVVRYVAASDPLVTSGKQLPEYSIGLWQINMVGTIGEERKRALGITDATQLKDPYTNARAAYWLSQGGNPAVVHQHWRINQPGPPWYYQENYQKWIPEAQAAARRVEGSGVAVTPVTPVTPPAGTSGTPGNDTDWTWIFDQQNPNPNPDDSEPINVPLIAGVGAAALLLMAMISASR